MDDHSTDHLFRSWADNSPDAVIRVDREFRYRYVNAAYARLLGLTPPDAISRTNREIGVPEPWATLVEDRFRRVFETVESLEFEDNFSTTDGTRYLHTRIVPESGRDGSVETALAILHDITERRRVENALMFLVQCGCPASSEDFFQALARYLATNLGMDYVCIARFDDNLLAARTVTIYFDGKFEDNVSYTLKETPCGDVVGKAICVFPRDVRHLFPNDEVLQQMVAESYVGTTLWGSRGQPIGLIALIGRNPLPNPELATSFLQLVALRAAGELERRQAEDALRDSEAAVQRVNQELRAAVEKLQSTGDDLAAANWGLRASNESLEARVRLRTADLQRRSTQLRALALELTRAEERERRRVAELIHDQLQQLLVVARIDVELLNRQCVCETVCEEVRKVDDLIGQSLTVARTLTAELSPSVLYRGGLAAALQWLARWYEDRHGLAVSVITELDADVDSEEIRITLFRSVRELLFNVVKHAKVRSAEVRVGREDRIVRIAVSDDGAGFDAAEVRAREGTSGSFGLFSLRERLEALGGNLDVDSAPGRGTRITIRAPIPEPSVSATPAARRAVATPHTRQRRGRKIRVVLVDDHAVVRDGLARALGDERDLEVVGQAADGDLALNLVRKLRPDVVLMDISLPTIDGIEATRRILAEVPLVRVIGLSMFDDDSHRSAMRRAGATDCLDKTAPLARVVEAIRRQGTEQG
ncbi:MAG TPA: response regulator [Vicinamibacterales bacterium]